MKQSLLRYFIFIFSIALIISSILTGILISNQNLNSMKQDMLYAVKLIDYSLTDTEDLSIQINEINPFVFTDDSRITIINHNGDVLADTYNEGVIDNHKDRKEVKDALEDGVGYDLRTSNTTGQKLLYVAYNGGEYITRLAMPYNGLKEHLMTLGPTLFISVIVSCIVSLILSRRFVRNISKPIIDICNSLESLDHNFNYESKDYNYDEFNRIANTIENLSHRLRKTLAENKLQQNKLDEVLKQMNEGFVLLDSEYKVININNKALSILGPIHIKGEFIHQVKIKELIEALDNPISKQYIELKIQNIYYACYISRTKLGTTLLFVDITSVKQNEKMRSEFFSNVSHELKTPMTSIRGYSELLSQGIISDEDKKQMMFNKIQSEVDNMMNLINDILMLSRIEYTENNIEYVPIKLDKILEEVLERFEFQLHKRHITVIKDVGQFTYYGNQSHMYTLLSNLLSNAIKYNKEEGTIYIIIKEKPNEVILSVEDSGIGIPLKDHTRVFERFYRVDKARSRQSGGTGLGLAIVKHIVSSCNGLIRLKSEINVGTKIEVILPKK